MWATSNSRKDKRRIGGIVLGGIFMVHVLVFGALKKSEGKEEDPKMARHHLMDFGFGGIYFWGAGGDYPEEKFPFSAQKFKIEIGTCCHFQIQNLSTRCDFIVVEVVGRRCPTSLIIDLSNIYSSYN